MLAEKGQDRMSSRIRWKNKRRRRRWKNKRLERKGELNDSQMEGWRDDISDERMTPNILGLPAVSVSIVLKLFIWL